MSMELPWSISTLLIFQSSHQIETTMGSLLRGWMEIVSSLGKFILASKSIFPPVWWLIGGLRWPGFGGHIYFWEELVSLPIVNYHAMVLSVWHTIWSPYFSLGSLTWLVRGSSWHSHPWESYPLNSLSGLRFTYFFKCPSWIRCFISFLSYRQSLVRCPLICGTYTNY